MQQDVYRAGWMSIAKSVLRKLEVFIETARLETFFGKGDLLRDAAPSVYQGFDAGNNGDQIRPGTCDPCFRTTPGVSFRRCLRCSRMYILFCTSIKKPKKPFVAQHDDDDDDGDSADAENSLRMRVSVPPKRISKKLSIALRLRLNGNERHRRLYRVHVYVYVHVIHPMHATSSGVPGCPTCWCFSFCSLIPQYAFLFLLFCATTRL